MNLRSRMEHELDQLASADASGEDLNFSLGLDDGGVLECELAEVDSLACAVRRLRYRRGRM